MLGTFLESAGDRHVELRSALLDGGSLAAPAVPELAARAASLLTENLHLIEASLRLNGLCVVQLDEPLTVDQFIRLGSSLGPLDEERDATVQPCVERRVLLHLRTTSGPTERVDRQPFASNFVTLHTESSGRHVRDQPRYIALMCVDPGEIADSPQTVVVSMESVVGRLTLDAVEVLRRTRYDNDCHSPPILRQEDGRWVICFRDFHRQSLTWVHDGTQPTSRVNAAIRDLLASAYDQRGAAAISWRRGTLCIIENRRYLHGRTQGTFLPGKLARHLVRLRIRAVDSVKPAAVADPPRQARPLLYAEPLAERAPPEEPEVVTRGPVNDPAEPVRDVPLLDERTLDVFARAEDPTDPKELRDLWLGRVESELDANALRPDLAARWRASHVRRTVSEEDVLGSRATVRMVKELFNTYFRDDLYGALRSNSNVILSSGALDEEIYGLPEALKETVRFALARDWYGYSDSRGREPARGAVAAYESARMRRADYCAENVVLTMGATQAVASLADFVLCGRSDHEPALCAIPNYPPLVEAVARRHAVRLVPTPSRGGATSLDALTHALSPRTPLVLLQTASNPSGSLVDEVELERFIEATSPSTIVLLDECHEWLGAPRRFSPSRARANVVRVSSLSKEWSSPGLKVGWFLADPGFVASYYEYASTSYGGPPSVLYTLVEVLARFERWRIEGCLALGTAQVQEFEAAYGLTVDTLDAAYQSYCRERRQREQSLLALRKVTIAGLQQVGANVLPPRCSINMLAAFPGYDDSYRCFRELLRETNVSVYPGVLGFHLAEGWFRVTFARKWRDLRTAFERLQQHCPPVRRSPDFMSGSA